MRVIVMDNAALTVWNSVPADLTDNFSNMFLYVYIYHEVQKKWF